MDVQVEQVPPPPQEQGFQATPTPVAVQLATGGVARPAYLGHGEEAITEEEGNKAGRAAGRQSAFEDDDDEYEVCTRFGAACRMFRMHEHVCDATNRVKGVRKMHSCFFECLLVDYCWV